MTAILIVANKVIKKQIHNCAVRSGIAISLTGISAQIYRNLQLLYKEIRANRKERRLIKDELLIVGNVLQEINPSCLQRDRIQRAIDGLYTREYTFRIVDDENINSE